MLSPDLASLLTVLTVVVFANAINLIDGLDGLAAGIVVIAGTALFLYSDRLFKAGLPRGFEHRAAGRDHRRSESASGSCHATSTRHGSSWATPVRCFLGLLLAITTITVGGRTDDQFSGTRPTSSSRR